MVVQHNLSAMNANRMLGITQGTLSKSTEKLSSGYAINRAADNAAGLSISEKMRKQIRGLDQASANAEDGISAVQTAEGALAEVTDMLQRMNELAVQSANGTNSENDRAYIQDEIDQLVTEIDRVAETTKFNETYLLKGEQFKEGSERFSIHYKQDSDAAATASFKPDTASGLKLETDFAPGAGSSDEVNTLVKLMRDQGVTVTYTKTDAGNALYTLALNGADAGSYTVVTSETASSDVGEAKFDILNADGTKLVTVTVSADTNTTKVGATAVMSAWTVEAAHDDADVYSYYDKNGNAISQNDLSSLVTVDDGGNIKINAESTYAYDALGKKIKVDISNFDKVKDVTTKALQMSFQVGADTSGANKITVNIDSMSAKTLGINGIRVDGSDSSNADAAVNTIEAAIQKVSTQRSALGAVQNRLEHTIKNLDNVVENTTSAESAIRDTDMATEMVKYSNANIIAQAGQSMLAQANQSNQGVLSLIG